MRSILSLDPASSGQVCLLRRKGCRGEGPPHILCPSKGIQAPHSLHAWWLV